MNNAYTHLARFYDQCIGVDYQEWVDYILSLLLRCEHSPEKVLDLGCGTGSITLLLAERGCDLTGVDLSAEMIEVARAKAAAKKLNLRYIVQDLRYLKLSHSDYDTVISTCDVLNYLLAKTDLELAFRAVYDHLRPSGLWLFDLNSARKLQKTIGGQSYADLHPKFAYFWDNTFDWENQICEMVLTFFTKAPSGLYRRETEKHRQKLWLPGEIESTAKKFGFELLGCWDFLSTFPCSKDSERWQFALRKTD